MANHTLINHLDRAFINTLAEDVREGLSGVPKTLPSKYFYDGKGSLLFEEICLLDEYYPTRTEQGIIREMAGKYMEKSAGCDIIELGSGSHEKISLFFDAAYPDLRKTMRYVPVDISEDAVESAMEALERRYPELPVMGIIADFTHHMEEVAMGRPSRYLFLGGTIGNFEKDQAGDFLREISRVLTDRDLLLVGFDMVKDRDLLEQAYNDSRGCTARFNLNVLEVVNRELGGNFDTGAFEHRAFFNEEESRIEMHLEANRDITIRLESLDLDIEMKKGETIHTENSHKYTPASIENLAAASGLKVLDVYSDPRNWFSLVEMQNV